jgi:hypothetical protein
MRIRIQNTGVEERKPIVLEVSYFLSLLFKSLNCSLVTQAAAAGAAAALDRQVRNNQHAILDISHE